VASSDLLYVPRLSDTVIGSPGMNDNAAGAAALIEIARNMSISGSLHNRVKFAWWGAEELGLLGSRQYVRDHIARAGVRTSHHSACVCDDGLSTPQLLRGAGGGSAGQSRSSEGLHQL
jgi:hypothetical protein